MFSWFFCSSFRLRQAPCSWAPVVRFISLSASPSVADNLCLLLFVGVRAQVRFSSHPPIGIQTLPFSWGIWGANEFPAFSWMAADLCFISVQDSGQDWVDFSPPKADLFCLLSVQVFVGKFSTLAPVAADLSWDGVNERVIYPLYRGQ